MLHVGELLDLARLDEHVAAGYVRVQHHPTEPLTIYNYTEKAQYEGAWDAITTTCRGLIVDLGGAVLARPFAKFFNYGDPQAGELDATAQAVVMDKMDGSLGIIHPVSDGWAVATRGSFTSVQAVHATAVLTSRYPDFVPPKGVTVLAEIVYPANRIVCDYGGADDLFLLGGVDLVTGGVVGPDDIPGWTGPAAKVFSVPTLADALALPPRPGAEGLVVRLVESGHMVKFKQADYVALHAIVTRTSARTVWEFCAVEACRDLIGQPKLWASRIGLDPQRAAEVLAMGDDWLDRLVERVPDDFHAWIQQTINGLRDEVAFLRKQINETATDLRAIHGDDRKGFAQAASSHDHSGALFQLYDRRDITPYLWKSVYPGADKPWGVRSEDTA